MEDHRNQAPVFLEVVSTAEDAEDAEDGKREKYQVKAINLQ
jgi:hypothetical protein